MADPSRPHLGIAARTTATKRLIEQHQDEFDKFYAEERVARGLPPDPKAAKAEARIKYLREQLRKLGYEGEV